MILSLPGERQKKKASMLMVTSLLCGFVVEMYVWEVRDVHKFIRNSRKRLSENIE